ncbi:MAG: hypothetical protein ACLUAW_09425 [Streptococcus salivarius]
MVSYTRKHEAASPVAAAAVATGSETSGLAVRSGASSETGTPGIGGNH